MNFDKDLAERHVNKTLRHYKIKVKKRSVGNNGRAWPSMLLVKIPHPTTVDRFCICMHEIKHIIDGSGGKRYAKEYACELYAIAQAEALGFNCDGYKERARRYIIMAVAKGHARGLNLDTIPQDVRDFCQVDFIEWVDHRIFVTGWGDAHYKGIPLVIRKTPK